MHVGVGANASVEFELTRRDLSIWDIEVQKWKLPGGEYKLWVGQSSRILPLSGSLSLNVGRGVNSIMSLE